MTQRFSLSSSQLPEHERVPAWAALVGENIFGGHFETVGVTPFDAALTAAAVGPAVCLESKATPVLFHHRKTDVEPPQAQRLIVQAVLEGRPVYFEDGAGRYAAQPGDVVIGMSHNACGFVADDNTRIASVALPRSLAVPRYASTEAVYRRFEERDYASGPAARLLFDLVAGLGRGDGTLWRPATIAGAVGGLVALTLDGLAPEKLGRESAGAARLPAILHYLRTHHADPSLNAVAVADAFQISARYLSRLIEQSGRSLREELLAIRLEAALNALRDGTLLHLKVADIAIASGFRDLSHFNRQFRARFGMTPRQARGFAALQ